jgi:hypothetical protein
MFALDLLAPTLVLKEWVKEGILAFESDLAAFVLASFLRDYLIVALPARGGPRIYDPRKEIENIFTN